MLDMLRETQKTHENVFYTETSVRNGFVAGWLCFCCVIACKYEACHLLMKHEKYKDIEFTKMWKELENLDVATVVMFTCSLYLNSCVKWLKKMPKSLVFLYFQVLQASGSLDAIWNAVYSLSKLYRLYFSFCFSSAKKLFSFEKSQLHLCFGSHWGKWHH